MTFNLFKKQTSWACLFALVFFVLAGSMQAQQTLGSVNGTVTDPTGAGVGGATVTVSDPEIGVTRTVTSQHNGFFQVFNLPIGHYSVKAEHSGFQALTESGIMVQEAQATTVNMKLPVGEATSTVTVTANPMLNATDTTNGYTLNRSEIAMTPLATGSFTQLAILSPGTNSELLSSLNTNAGLGNQPIWANGQRDTDNTFQVNGVDSTNLFNGDSASADVSQRYNFNIGESNGTGNSVFGSNGNSLPSPPPEFTQELRVNTSLYDAEQGATSGAQIDVNTLDGTNQLHGQIYGNFASNYAGAAPFFDRQKYLLATDGIGVFPASLANPALHRWTTGMTLGGPIKKDKLFFFLAYQHLYASDEGTAYSQLSVPSGLTNDRSDTGLMNALDSWDGVASGTTVSGFTGISPQAYDLFNAKVPNGQYMIPSAPANAGNVVTSEGVEPNVLLQGVSVLDGDMANAAIDYQATANDRLSVKYFYQNNPNTTPFGFSNTFGFPATEANSAEVGVIDNTILIGSRFNWEQRLGFVREGTYSYYRQQVTDTTTPSAGGSFGMNDQYFTPGLMPGIYAEEFAVKATNGVPSVGIGPASTLGDFVDQGYHQNRINPSTNVIFTWGKHTIVAGSSYSYTQLNLDNNRTGHGETGSQNFEDFLEGQAYAKLSSVLDSVCGPPTCARLENTADRYYRSNELGEYLQDKWQALPNLSITVGVRWDYHGGFTEKYGNLFNFDPSHYNVSGTDTTGFTVTDAGLVVARNNSSPGISAADYASTDSTLTGRQWGLSPRVGFAWSPERDGGNVVISGGVGLYYDRGELFQYLSEPAGSGIGGPFGVTESAPLASYIQGSGKSNTLADPLASNSAPALPNANPASMVAALQTQLNSMTASTTSYGLNCGGVGQEEDESCPAPLPMAAYDQTNKLPYTINYTFKVQWQPTNTLAFSIGYAGNVGRHAIVPVPFNEPVIATASSPAMIGGANPHAVGENSTYGFEVLNASNLVDKYKDFAPITTEPWDTYDGGNTDWRVPYPGYNPNATAFKAAGISAYNSLQTHLEKRLSHNLAASISYTWSHALDEQSDIGLFFTGNNPANLRSSYASADFDRTNVITGNFQVLIPNAVHEHNVLSYLTNDWSLNGIGVVQSGEPYSLYEYNGAVSSINYGNYPSLENPVLGIKDPQNPRSALTGNRGVFRGPGGNYIPSIDPSQIAINYIAPGQDGVPTAAMSSNPTDPVDIYETGAAVGDQRNIFRQAMQKRLDISLRKTFHIKQRFALQYAFNVYNVFNTTSEDVPNNHASIRQTYYDCSTSAFNANGGSNDCTSKYTYDQIATTNDALSQQQALAHLDQIPEHTGSGNTTQIPLLVPVEPVSTPSPCTTSNELPGTTNCANNNPSFGSVSGTIGGPRTLTMGLHLLF